MKYSEKEIIKAARTDIECEMPGAVLLYIATAIRDKHIQLMQLQKLTKAANASTRNLDSEIEANERVGGFLLSVISDNFGSDFLDMFMKSTKESDLPGNETIN